MSIQAPILRIACLFALAFGWGDAVSGARGTLHLDGILQIRGGAAPSARIVVLPTGGMPYAMDNVSGPFKMSLPLDGTYLLSFEREGLVTKQVYFDTSVPLGKHESELSFLFKVTLFSLGANDVYEYAGPVGFVHYEASEQDFDYETDYTLKPGMPMFRRITTLMAQMQDRGADGLPKAAVVTYSASNTSAGSMTVPEEGVSTLVQSENIGTEQGMAALIHAPGEALVEIAEELPTRSAKPEATPILGNKEEEKTNDDPALGDTMATTVEPPHIQLQRNGAIGTEMDPRDLPAEELIVERNRVITVVRVTEATGQVSEFRRVADRHGMVVHFRDGVQIPEQLYRDSTGR
ncbi:MAG: hypothetical protein WEC15_01255 [Flavobacteriales bacterium]